MLEEVPTEELQPVEAAAGKAGREEAGHGEERHLGRPGLRVLLRRLPRRRLPAADADRSQGAAADREHALDARRRSPTTCSGSCRCRPTTRRCARSARPSSATSTTTATWSRRSRSSRRWGRGRSRTSSARCGWCRASIPIGVAARDLQECLLLQLRHLGLGGTPAERIVTEHMRLLQNHQVPGAGAQARDVDRRAEAAHRGHPAPRSEAGQPLQPVAVAVRDPRRLRRQGRGSVRGGAQRRRAAAAAHQPGLPPAARQGRARTPTRRAPT